MICVCVCVCVRVCACVCCVCVYVCARMCMSAGCPAEFSPPPPLSMWMRQSTVSSRTRWARRQQGCRRGEWPSTLAVQCQCCQWDSSHCMNCTYLPTVWIAIPVESGAGQFVTMDSPCVQALYATVTKWVFIIYSTVFFWLDSATLSQCYVQGAVAQTWSCNVPCVCGWYVIFTTRAYI